MPDHIHLIIGLSNESDCESAKSISLIIGQMKRWVSKQAGFSLWQKSYYEHIIKNEADYAKTVEYIRNNPLKSK